MSEQVLAIGFEGGGVWQADVEGRFFLQHNQVAMLDMLELLDGPGASDGLPGTWSLEFPSRAAREQHLLDAYGRFLMQWRASLYDVALGWHYPIRMGECYAQLMGWRCDERGRPAELYFESSSDGARADPSLFPLPMPSRGAAPAWISVDSFRSQLAAIRFF